MLTKGKLRDDEDSDMWDLVEPFRWASAMVAQGSDESRTSGGLIKIKTGLGGVVFFNTGQPCS
jgi:hypothetical protein